MARLYMMMGYPGAGKTTTANVLHELTGAVHLSSDAMRSVLFVEPDFSEQEHATLYEHLDKTTVDLLKAGQDVIYDANLNRLQHRQEKYAICEQAGAEPVLLWLKTPRDMAKERAGHMSRQHLWPPNTTPEQLFEHVANVIEEPGANERYTEVDGTKVTPEYIKELLGL